MLARVDGVRLPVNMSCTQYALLGELLLLDWIRLYGLHIKCSPVDEALQLLQSVFQVAPAQAANNPSGC